MTNVASAILTWTNSISLINYRKTRKFKRLHVQQTPNPEAQVPAEVPLLAVHSELERELKEHSQHDSKHLCSNSLCVYLN
jgi:hypothetical protein